MITRLKAAWKALTTKPKAKRRDYVTIVNMCSRFYIWHGDSLYREKNLAECYRTVRVAIAFGPDSVLRKCDAIDAKSANFVVVESFQI